MHNRLGTRRDRMRHGRRGLLPLSDRMQVGRGTRFGRKTVIAFGVTTREISAISTAGVVRAS